MWQNRESLKVFGGIERSKYWPRIRRKHLDLHPVCAVCGGDEKCEVHHIEPFNQNPSLECEMSNLITLCEKRNCHLIFGHLGSYRSWNVNIVEDARKWYNKITNRPNIINK